MMKEPLMAQDWFVWLCVVLVIAIGISLIGTVISYSAKEYLK